MTEPTAEALKRCECDHRYVDHDEVTGRCDECACDGYTESLPNDAEDPDEVRDGPASRAGYW